MTFDSSVRYQKSHEWAKKDGDVYLVGISDYAQDSLGDVVFVELPEVGTTKERSEPFGVVESVKAASDVYMPISGEVVEINEALEDNSGLVNEEPFGKGWLIKVKASNEAEANELLSADEYEEYTKGLEE